MASNERRNGPSWRSKRFVNNSRPLLIIEDSHEDYELVTSVLATSGITQPIYRLVIGSDTLDYLNRRMGHQKHEDEPLPSLILLDLHLPAANGLDVLREIKTSARFRNIPVVVMSTSARQLDIQSCYSAGANSYIVKSIDTPLYLHKIKVMADYWLNCVEFPE